MSAEVEVFLFVPSGMGQVFMLGMDCWLGRGRDFAAKVVSSMRSHLHNHPGSSVDPAIFSSRLGARYYRVLKEIVRLSPNY